VRLATFRQGGSIRFGSVEGDRIVDLTGTDGHTSLLSALRAGAVDRLISAAKVAKSAAALADVTLLPPIPDPRAIFCVGVNYPDRNEEYKDNAAAAKYPSLFMRVPDSLTGHGSPILRPLPGVSEQFDYEGEIVLVIGKEGRRIPEDRALDHVAGATLGNEGSVRDWLRHSKFNVTPGKNFDRSGSMGPWLVTRDEIDLGKPLHLTTRVNGELRQDDTTDRLIFGFARLIGYLSTFATMKPGDVIFTGTPTGAGARLAPPRWLKPGDVIEVAAPEIGVLRNTVADDVA
jgi:2-keto-4-pentenoate hydratase/2-oxohepta-3-ene-1,7-dioic acid hydratase in catechol pathway